MQASQQIETIECNDRKAVKQGFLLRLGPPNIPDTVFQDIIQIWDTFRSFAEIIHDIINKKEENNSSELKQVGVNVGQMLHFKKFFKKYFLQLSLNDFYECFKQTESNQFYVDILLFLSSFYLKQIIEDIEQENQFSRFYNKGSIWQLLNFLWIRDKEAYFDVVYEKVYELPIDIQSFGILQLVEDETSNQDSFDVRLNLVKQMSDGLMELKRTSTLLQYRTESILFTNRLRQTLGKGIRDTRSKLVVTKEELNQKDLHISTLKIQLEIGKDLTRQEQAKINRQIDQLQKETYKLRNLSIQEAKQLEDLQESYATLDKVDIFNFYLQTIRYSTLPQLYHNQSLYLGVDQEQTLYYYFLHDPVRIYYQKGVDQQRWGYINKQEQIEKLIKNENLKKNKEHSLKNNLQLLLASKLLQQDSLAQNLDQFVVEFFEFNSWKIIKESLARAELSLSGYLATIQGRWVGLEERKQFRTTLSAVENNEAGLLELTRQLDFFLEKTATQERLEVKDENDVNGYQNNDAMEIEIEEVEQYNIPTNKRRVVEDESESQTSQGGQLDLLEHMDPTRIRIKRLPLKLFGTIYECLRACCIDLVRNVSVSLGDILLIVLILDRVIEDYVARKMEKEQEQIKIKQQVEDVEKTEPRVQEYQPTKNLRIRPKQKPQNIENVNNWEDQCKICSQTGKVICCDTCPSVFHSKCLGLKQIPQGKWSCFQCLSRMEAQIKTRSTLRKFQV